MKSTLKCWQKFHTLYAWYLKLFLGAEDEGLSKMKNYYSDCTSSSHFTSDGRQVEVLDVYSWYVKMKVSSLNVVGIPVIKAVYTCTEHISRDNSYCCNHFFLVGVYLFWQIACLCVFSKTKQNPSIFSYCLLLFCRYSRAGKYIKKVFAPYCLAQKATIFAIPMFLWIVLSSHICIPSVFFFISLLFQEQATKVVSKQPRLWFLVPSSLCIG